VENYPGFPGGVGGFDLMDRMKSQAEEFGLKIISTEVKSIVKESGYFSLQTDSQEFKAKAVILAMGASPKKLHIPGEELLTGKGVSYCATCDGFFYRDQEVAVIGGGDTAIEEALFLTRFCSKVHVIHRRDRLRAIRVLQERAFKEPKIEFIWNTIPLKILGNDQVQGLLLRDLKSQREQELKVQGVFVFIGYAPNSAMVKDLVELDQMGFVITDADMRTSQEGMFAAGDIRAKSLRQISTAVGDGAIAANSALRYLEGY
jgi:thioredoxin reductase (NADPH)